MADKANITPKVLQWARESAKMTEEIAAAKISVSVTKIREWEEGTTQPTIRQAQTLAKAYKRPFALFFLPEIPRDFQPLQDFRKKNSKALGTASIFIIREIQQKQAWISAVIKENGEEKIPLVGKFSIQDDPVVVADDILKTLDISPSYYKTDNPIKEWIDKAESKGIFISRTSFIYTRLKLNSEEIQGFAIADSYAPFIFINSDDWNAPQLFTLVHELAHIWIAETGISNEIEPYITNKDIVHPVELYCNEVAANALMPKYIINVIQRDTFKSADEIFRASKKLGISSFAFIVRALNLNIISFDVYKKLRHDVDIKYAEFIEREAEKEAKRKERGKKIIVDTYLMKLNRNSRLFTQLVLDAFHGGYIQPTLASNLLNIQVNKFPKLEARLFR